VWFPPGCPVNGLSLPLVVGFTQWATHGTRHLKANRSGGFLGVRRSQSFISNAELTLPGFGGPRVSPLTPNSSVSMQPIIARAQPKRRGSISFSSLSTFAILSLITSFPSFLFSLYVPLFLTFTSPPLTRDPGLAVAWTVHVYRTLFHRYKQLPPSGFHPRSVVHESVRDLKTELFTSTLETVYN